MTSPSQRGGRVKVRLATLKDVPTLVRHRRAMFEDMGEGTPGELDALDDAYRRWVRMRLSNATLVGFVAADGSRVVGSGVVWLQPIQPRPGFLRGRQPYLMGMFTEPDVRGRGVARAIVEAAIGWVEKAGFPRFTLHASDMGRPLYEKLGFVGTNEMKLKVALTPARRAPPRAPRAARPPSPDRSPTARRRARPGRARQRSTGQ